MQSLANADEFTLSADSQNAADVCNRGDGVTNKDALAIQMYMADLVTEFPIEL